MEAGRRADRSGIDGGVRVGLLAIVCAFFANVICWGRLYPINSAPDEHVRFYMVEHLERFGRLPAIAPAPNIPFTGAVSGFRYSANEWWYSGLPNLDVFGAWLTTHLFSGLFPGGEAFMATRLFDWLLAPVFAALVALIALQVADSRRVALLCAACVLAIPQITFIFAYLNSDALALTVGAATLHAALRCAQAPSASRAIGFGVAAGLLVCTKIYYLPVLPAALAIIALGSYRRTGRIPGISLRLSSLAALSFCAIALPVLLFTYHLYGEMFGMNGQTSFIDVFKSDPRAKYGTCFLLCGNDLVNGPELKWWLWLMFRSFFFVGGTLDIFLSPRLYTAFFLPISLAVAVIGSVHVYRRVGRAVAGDREAVWGVGVVLLFWGLLGGIVVMNLLGQQRLVPQPQGRYLFAAVPFLALMLSELAGGRFRSSAKGLAAADSARAVWVGAVLLALIGVNGKAYTESATSPNLYTKPLPVWK